MKKIIFLTITTLVFTSLYAQEEKNSDIETLFSKPSKIRGYISPITNTTYLNGEIAYMSGMNVAGILNDHLIIGFYKLDLDNSSWSNSDNYIGSTMSFNHKGLYLGYILMPKRIVHFTTNVQLGKGNMEIYDSVLDEWIQDDMVFVAVPSVEVEFNVTKFFRFGVGANYRFTTDVDKFANYSDSDFSDFGVSVSFKFGWFK